MNVEITKLFIIEIDEAKNTMTGSIAVRLPDLGLSILGIFVSRRKEFWSFHLPGKYSVHHESGQKIWFPHVSFDDKEQHRALMEAIRMAGRSFIEKSLSDKQNPLVFIKKPQKKSEKGGGRTHQTSRKCNSGKANSLHCETKVIGGMERSAEKNEGKRRYKIAKT